MAVGLVAIDFGKSSERLQKIGIDSNFNTTQTFSPALVVTNVIVYILSFVGLVFLVMILYSGFKMIFAGGNDQEIDAAKTRLKNAVLGFIVIVLAFSILLFIRATVLNVL